MTDEELPPRHYYTAPYVEDHWPHMTGNFPTHHAANPFVEEAKKSADIWDFQYYGEWYESPKDKGMYSYSPLWTAAPLLLLALFYSEIKKSNQYRKDKKLNANIWRMGCRDPGSGFNFRI